MAAWSLMYLFGVPSQEEDISKRCMALSEAGGARNRLAALSFHHGTRPTRLLEKWATIT